MEKSSKEFLYSLLETPSPSGFEEKIQSVVAKHVRKFADDVEIDLHGNLIAVLNPKAARKVMLAGHCDQIALMVTHISKEGFLWVAAMGGVDVGVLPGSQVTVHTEKGPIPGVVGRKPIHHHTPDERSSMKLDIAKIWIDIGAKTGKEAEKRIKIGDPITFKPGVTELSDDLICGPGLDDRVGLFVAFEALRLCAGSKLSVGLYAVSTVQEEVGLRGASTSAYRINPEVGIAIDVTHASDNPGSDNPRAVPVKLGAGPAISRGPNVNPIVERLLVEAAKKLKIPHQPVPWPKVLGNDAAQIQIARGGVAAGHIGIPNRYMHTQVEVCSLKDLENAAKLLAGFVKGIGAKTDFRPRVG